MSVISNIEWTDSSWNPVRGCAKISPGCKHCYAQTFAERFRGVKGHPFEQGFDLRLVPEKLYEPFKWQKARKVFVNSMSDLFHENVPDEFVVQTFEVMGSADWHTYQVLTKRPERMKTLLEGPLKRYADKRNIWLGVSVEDREYGLPRIDLLRGTPAAMRFLSIEPLLEDLGQLNLDGIGWVIVGGESGHGARPMREEWVQSILEECGKHKIPFFFKQWGGLNKKRNGRTLNNRTYDEYPEIISGMIPSRLERLELIESFTRATR